MRNRLSPEEQEIAKRVKALLEPDDAPSPERYQEMIQYRRNGKLAVRWDG